MWKNVGIMIVDKTKAFVFEAGKVILAISIILWVLASFGPDDKMEKARETVLQESANMRLTEQGLADKVAAYKLEHSYAGVIGKAIEPVIRPLGFDWKIGIALITSLLPGRYLWEPLPLSIAWEAPKISLRYGSGSQTKSTPTRAGQGLQWLLVFRC